MQDQYRKGFVLGLTMAEVMILLLFGLMLALVSAAYESDEFQEISDILRDNGIDPGDVGDILVQHREFQVVLDRKGLEWGDAKEFLEQLPDAGESPGENRYGPSEAKERLAQLQELQKVLDEKDLTLSDAKEFLQQLPDPGESSGEDEYGPSNAKEQLVQHQELQKVLDDKGLGLSDAKEFLQQLPDAGESSGESESGLSNAKEQLVQHQELQDVLDRKGLDLSDAKEILEQMPDAEENETGPSDAKERLAQLQELNDILEEKGLDPREAKDILEQLPDAETEEQPEEEIQDPFEQIADLKKDNERLKEDNEDIRKEYDEWRKQRGGRGGIDRPPCWRTGLRSPVPSFNVNITPRGYEFERLETPGEHVGTESATMHDDITTDRLSLSPEEMRMRTAELDRWSREEGKGDGREEGCAFFVRIMDCTGPDKQLYKERLRALKRIFYQYGAEKSCRSN